MLIPPFSFRKQQGLTLIEMMVTVSILGILAAIAVPNMQDWIKDVRLATQSDQLVASLGAARLEAIKRRSNITFCPATNANTATSCSTAITDWSKGWLITSPSEIAQRFIVQPGITVNSAANSGSLVFNSTFGSAQTVSTFTLCMKGRKQHRVDVALSGHISKSITTILCN